MNYLDNQHSSESFVPISVRSQQKPCQRWTRQENFKYITFLKLTKNDFEQEYTRRVNKVFKRLAQFVGTRNMYQCKSHHQKMVQVYQSLQNIIQGLQERTKPKIQAPKVKFPSGKNRQELLASLESIFSKIQNLIKFQRDLYSVIDM